MEKLSMKRKDNWKQELFEKLLNEELIEIKKASYGHTIVITDKFKEIIDKELEKKNEI